MRRKRVNTTGKKPGQDTGEDISAIPYAGINQIRFNGYDLRPCATPAKKRMYVSICIEKSPSTVNDYLYREDRKAGERRMASPLRLTPAWCVEKEMFPLYSPISV